MKPSRIHLHFPDIDNMLDRQHRILVTFFDEIALHANYLEKQRIVF